MGLLLISMTLALAIFCTIVTSLEGGSCYVKITEGKFLTKGDCQIQSGNAVLHELDAKVKAIESTRALSIRLVGGNGINSGRVEVLHNGIWGTICDDKWDTDDGNVVCRMMGYTTATSAPQNARFGQGTGQIWLESVACVGSESDISSCPKSPWGAHDCTHREDASVICS